MAKIAFLDTGPLVSFIDKREYHHTWIKSVFSEIDASLKTNTAVITEAFFLLKRSNRGEEGLMKMINSGFLEIQDPFSSNQRFVLDVMNKYNDVPCAFADANLLAMFENDKNS
ncbi:MAG TPA: hypothetical protein DF712_14370, partial [Balneola sp.]|nr:hypothetical protein [Balneola sp.]